MKYRESMQVSSTRPWTTAPRFDFRAGTVDNSCSKEPVTTLRWTETSECTAGAFNAFNQFVNVRYGRTVPGAWRVGCLLWLSIRVRHKVRNSRQVALKSGCPLRCRKHPEFSCSFSVLRRGYALTPDDSYQIWRHIVKGLNNMKCPAIYGFVFFLPARTLSKSTRYHTIVISC